MPLQRTTYKYHAANTSIFLLLSHIWNQITFSMRREKRNHSYKHARTHKHIQKLNQTKMAAVDHKSIRKIHRTCSNHKAKRISAGEECGISNFFETKELKWDERVVGNDKNACTNKNSCRHSHQKLEVYMCIFIAITVTNRRIWALYK